MIFKYPYSLLRDSLSLFCQFETSSNSRDALNGKSTVIQIY